MGDYQAMRDVDVPRQAWVWHALRLVSVIGFFVYGLLWWATSTVLVIFFAIVFHLSGPRGVIVMGLIYAGLIVAYLIRFALRVAKARRLIREGTFVTAVVADVRQFRGPRGSTGTSIALDLPQDIGVGRVSFVLDGGGRSLSVGDEVPVLVVPKSDYCAAFPGEGDLVPAGAAKSWLMRVLG
jgi:hypothetical protein